ncbi:MAG: hypothetical protein ACK5N8_06050 [Alphaproteobacteria bacterium]
MFIANTIKILFAFFSTLSFLMSALSKYPNPPKKGDLVVADYPQKLSSAIGKSSKYNFLGALFMFIALGVELAIMVYASI